MKLPYRVGDSCDVPLGDGRVARARIVAQAHHLVDLAIEGGERDVLVLRTTDRALVLQRWHRRGRGQPSVEATVPRFARIVGPAHAERLAARALGVALAAEAPLVVRAVHAFADLGATLAAIPGDAMLVLSATLAHAQLAALEAWFATHPHATLRLDGAGAQHVATVASWRLGRLVVAGNVSLERVRAPHVRRLDVLVPCASAQVVRAFPALESLRVSALRADVDIAALAELEALRALDCAHVRLVTPTALARLRTLRALRIAGVIAPPPSETIAALALRTLAIEAQSTYGSLHAIVACEHLEELELRELWQFAIDDVAFVHGMRSLVRVEIDIGGRRKNVELYRRATWAHPWPFAFVR